jgi:raffinose/stachyose/melibiose transport system permease protein
MRSRISIVGVHAVLIAYTLLAVLPILLVVMNSFKNRNAIFGAPLSPPSAETFSLIGYAKVLGNAHVFTYFANSMIVTLGSMFLVLLFGAMAAWALTEYKFRGSTALALYLAIGIMVPIRLGSVAIVTMMRKTGLNDTLTALILVYVAQGLPMSIFILSEFIEQIPKDLRDAARCDGVPETRIFFEVIAPLLRPAIATVAVFTIVPIWNDLWFSGTTCGFR